jgi:Ca2+-binding RTX toxin-like protein
MEIDYVQPGSGYAISASQIDSLLTPMPDGDGGSGDGGGDTPPPDDTDPSDFDNVVDGTAAGEQLLGTTGKDLIHGLAGDDTLFGFSGDDRLEGDDGNDYLSGGNGSFAGSGDDTLVGGAGADTLVGEDGNDTLKAGAGDDQYVWQAGSDFDLIDNTGGGTDWLFFNGVDRTRLGFHRDGDDLVIMVDDDAGQGVRIQNHFLGGDLAISYVQPSDGYAIPASEIDSLLTPMPDSSQASSMALRPTEPVARAIDSSPEVAPSALPASPTHEPLWWRANATGWSVWQAEILDSPRLGLHRSGMSGTAQAPVGLHQLVAAMASFSPAHGADLDAHGFDDSMGVPLMAMLSNARRPHLVDSRIHQV